MISFRYHVVAIIAIFLALAVGIALGSGPLRGEVDDTLVQQVKHEREAKASLQAKVSNLRSGNEFQNEFAQTAAPTLLQGRLEGRAVTIVGLPGASDRNVTRFGDLVETAGGTVAGRVRVSADLIDPSNKQLVDQLSSQMAKNQQGLSLPAGASVYERIGALVARAIATQEPQGASVDDTARSILAGLTTAKLLSAEGGFTQRGSLVLVVAGKNPLQGTAQDGSLTILVTMLSQIDQASGGVVVAGPPASARGEGLVASVRGDVAAAKHVSTVDQVSSAAGRVVTVLALAEQAQDSTGHYGGVDAADGAMPGAQATEDGSGGEGSGGSGEGSGGSGEGSGSSSGGSGGSGGGGGSGG